MHWQLNAWWQRLTYRKPFSNACYVYTVSLHFFLWCFNQLENVFPAFSRLTAWVIGISLVNEKFFRMKDNTISLRSVRNTEGRPDLIEKWFITFWEWVLNHQSMVREPFISKISTDHGRGTVFFSLSCPTSVRVHHYFAALLFMLNLNTSCNTVTKSWHCKSWLKKYFCGGILSFFCST